MNTRSLRFRLTVWYAGLLAIIILIFGFSTYFGLRQYLNRSLNETLRNQAQQIGENFIANIHMSGESYLIEEIKEHYAPELNNRFVRVVKADGNAIYISGKLRDGGIDPSSLPIIKSYPEHEVIRSEHPPGGELQILALTFTAHDGGKYLIEVGAPYEQVENVLHGLLITLAVALPIAVIGAVVGGYFLMRRALRPIVEITHNAEQISSQNLSRRLVIANTRDEIEKLSLSLNRMIERLDDSFQYIRRFTADASHELRTPLTILRGELEALAIGSNLDPQTREVIGSSLEETERLSRIVESLLTISHLDAGEARLIHDRFDLAEIAIMTAEQMRLLAEDKNIKLSCEADKRIYVEGDSAKLKQVVVNLLDNAFKYTNVSGNVSLSVTAIDKRAILDIEDNGIGISSEALPHLFERFYRADIARSRNMGGAGLGLAIVKSIVTAHNGQIEVESIENRRTRFRISLPLADPKFSETKTDISKESE